MVMAVWSVGCVVVWSIGGRAHSQCEIVECRVVLCLLINKTDRIFFLFDMVFIN